MNKIERDIRAVIEASGITIVERLSARNGHLHFLLQLPGGKRVKRDYPSSPRCLEHLLNRTRQECRMLINQEPS